VHQHVGAYSSLGGKFPLLWKLIHSILFSCQVSQKALKKQVFPTAINGGRNIGSFGGHFQNKIFHEIFPVRYIFHVKFYGIFNGVS
jgi:hypothetical protein